MVYEMTDSELSDRGGIKYTGDEELSYVPFSVNTSNALTGMGNDILKKTKPLYHLAQP